MYISAYMNIHIIYIYIQMYTMNICSYLFLFFWSPDRSVSCT